MPRRLHDIEPGDIVYVSKGDRIDAGPYGKLWVVATGVIGDLWTSELKEDITTGRGRSLRRAHVKAIQNAGEGKWYDVEWDRDEQELVLMDT